MFLHPGNSYSPTPAKLDEGSNINYFGQDLLLQLFYPNPNLIELKAISTGNNFKLGAWFDQGIFFFVYHLNIKHPLLLWGDASCSLHNNSPEELAEYDYSEPPSLIEIHYCNSTTGIFLGGNKLPLSRNLKEYIHSHYQDHINNYLPELTYFSRVQEVYRTYTVDELVKKAVF